MNCLLFSTFQIVHAGIHLGTDDSYLLLHTALWHWIAASTAHCCTWLDALNPYCFLLSVSHRSANIAVISPAQFAVVCFYHCPCLTQWMDNFFVIRLYYVLLVFSFACYIATVFHRYPVIVSTELLYNFVVTQTWCASDTTAYTHVDARASSNK